MTNKKLLPNSALCLFKLNLFLISKKTKEYVKLWQAEEETLRFEASAI